MKKARNRLLIFSFISILLSVICIILLAESYSISLKLIADSEYIELYTADINTYHTYIILLYILLFLGGGAGILTCFQSSKWWITLIPCILCLAIALYASSTVDFIPWNYPTTIGSILLIFTAKKMNEHYKIKTT